MTLTLLPLSFYAAVILIGLGVAFCFNGLQQGWGIPGVVVMLTVATWYVGDVFYNNYEEYYWQFGKDTLENAWWQVVLFLLTFLILVKPVNDGLNRKYADRKSFAVESYQKSLIDSEHVQHQIDRLFGLLLVIWVVLTVIGLSRSNWDFVATFFPYVAGYTAEPWGRGRIGGQFDALVSLAQYLSIFLTASFGLIFVVSRNSRTRALAGVCFFLSAPYYLFNRTRNTMLAVAMPGIMAWAVMRLRGGWPTKVAALLAGFALVNLWMLFIMGTRSQGKFAAQAFQQDDAFSVLSEAKHEGLNMFEELAWVNQEMVSQK